MPPAADILLSPALWVGIFILAAAIAVGFCAIVVVRRWLHDAAGDFLTVEQELECYLELHDEGELSQEEYDRVSRLVSQRHELPPAQTPTSEQAPKPGNSDSSNEETPEDPPLSMPG